jgi:hypothetical protein
MDCRPVLGQLTLRLMRCARLFGRIFPSYTCPMLCFSMGPSSKITGTAMSWVPPHLSQRAKVLYRTAEFLVVGGIASCMPSFSCMMHPHCPSLRWFRQRKISTKAVGKPVSKLLSYPIVRHVQSIRLPDCLTNEQ